MHLKYICKHFKYHLETQKSTSCTIRLDFFTMGQWENVGKTNLFIFVVADFGLVVQIHDDLAAQPPFEDAGRIGC